MESDCAPLITKLQNNSFPKGELGTILQGISTLALSFTECRWNHVRRQANKAADFLAGIRPITPFISSSFFSIPSKLKLILEDDLN